MLCWLCMCVCVYQWSPSGGGEHREGRHPCLDGFGVNTQLAVHGDHKLAGQLLHGPVVQVLHDDLACNLMCLGSVHLWCQLVWPTLGLVLAHRLGSIAVAEAQVGNRVPAASSVVVSERIACGLVQEHS